MKIAVIGLDIDPPKVEAVEGGLQRQRLPGSACRATTKNSFLRKGCSARLGELGDCLGCGGHFFDTQSNRQGVEWRKDHLISQLTAILTSSVCRERMIQVHRSRETEGVGQAAVTQD